ncbi:hypothetical protein [Stenotrophomonas sp. TD3]|uniref:hypothetical protein n=1 Tax=Stenotrophomonas sp. TD3 TaxID=1641707 RepID=UPI000950E803|nr:hypothetical protein [Stenotrophomonas sp. TD3]
MDYPDLAPLEEISGPFAVLSKGPKFIAAWLAKRTEERYREFTRAALEGQVFPENAEAMTSEDFLAMLRALEMDIEAEKATVYGRLACSIATGRTAGHLKRHFIKALMGAPSCHSVLVQLTEDGHRRAIHVHNSAALRGRSNRLLTPGPVMVVLLTDKPQRLADEWTTVEDTIRGRVLAVVATTDPNAPLPVAMTGLERIDASPDRAAEAVTAILERFEAKGLRGT